MQSQINTEEWRPVLGFEGWYEVSSLGNVRRIRVYHGKVGPIKSHVINSGYLVIDLWRDNKRTALTVHSVVAEAFICPRPPGYEVNHRDVNRLNNAAENLEWVTTLANHRYSGNAQKTHCVQGHAFDEANTYLYQGKRECRACRSAKVNALKKAKRAAKKAAH